ncbi:glutathione synthase [Sporolactobacillus sp. Y61]|jgi:glutamate--cysteine ligase|uniref:Glutamate--cysteine ligase n=1 Tax=Sporolactobacillus sp. Y61 TaxID=3160863 RepID=A0AAU8III1_9BACL
MSADCQTDCIAPWQGHFGLERENLRINPDGTLALTPHPRAFGNKLTHPQITTDFSESQLELVTPVTSSLHEAQSQLDCLTQKVCRGLGPELLWPLSNPPAELPPENQIPVANFGPEGRDKTDYRYYLAKKYGRYKQLYCGLHFNCSFDGLSGKTAGEKNHFYLHLAAQAMRYRFFLIHLLAASPGRKPDAMYRSVRLSAHGYRNTEVIHPDYSDAKAYLASLLEAIREGKIEGPRELYHQVRIKGRGFENPDEEPEATRIELRIPDLNPFYPSGISLDDLYLMHLFLIWAANAEDEAFDQDAQKKADALADQAALMDVSEPLKSEIDRVFERLGSFARSLTLPEGYLHALDVAKKRWRNPQKRYAERLITRFQRGETGLNLARRLKNTFIHKMEDICS